MATSCCCSVIIFDGATSHQVSKQLNCSETVRVFFTKKALQAQENHLLQEEERVVNLLQNSFPKTVASMLHQKLDVTAKAPNNFFLW